MYVSRDKFNYKMNLVQFVEFVNDVVPGLPRRSAAPELLFSVTRLKEE